MNIYKRIYWAVFNRLGKWRRYYYNLLPDVTVGRNTFIERGVVLRSAGGGKIVIGENCRLSQGVQLITDGGNIQIGNYTTINPYTIIYGQESGTIIGNMVRIAAHCTIVPANHRYDNPEKPIYQQGFDAKSGIVIEDDVWLGSGVRVLAGVNVSKGCVIGANSVVTKSTEQYGVYVGVPAHKIKSRD